MVYVEQQLTGVSNTVLMEGALQELNNSDALLAEVSDKAVGVGIEVGVAYTSGMPVVLFRQTGSEPSTTLEGLASTNPIEYDNPSDLKGKIAPIIETLPGLVDSEHREDRWIIKGHAERAKREAAALVQRYLNEQHTIKLSSIEQRFLLLGFAKQILEDKTYILEDSVPVPAPNERVSQFYKETHRLLRGAQDALSREARVIYSLNGVDENEGKKYETEAHLSFWNRPKETRYNREPLIDNTFITVLGSKERK
jgi:hypothetical protein